MSGRDIRFGRQGGRVLAWEPVPGELIASVCDGGHRALVVRPSIGEPCSACGDRLRRPDHIDEALAGGGRPDPELGFARVVVRAVAA